MQGGQGPAVPGAAHALALATMAEDAAADKHPMAKAPAVAIFDALRRYAEQAVLQVQAATTLGQPQL